jgi:hypothetical protein
LVSKGEDGKAAKGRNKVRRGKRWLLGLGLDGTDGHVRITRGENFRILGGSRETHEVMQEKVIRFNEEVGKRHKTLDELTKPEIDDIAHRVGMKDK